MTMREECQERVFRRKAESSDVTSLYRQLNAELDTNNKQRLRRRPYMLVNVA
jgi:hypothetical protein